MLKLRLIILSMVLGATGALALELPDSSWVMPGISEGAAKELLIEKRQNPLEGIWESSGEGTRVAIIPGSAPGSPRSLAGNYLIVLLDSPRPRLQPGTVIGVCTPYAKPHNYDCLMYTRTDGRRFWSAKRFTLNLADDTHLTMTEVHSGLKVTFGFTLPSIRFLRISNRNDRPSDLDGFIRLWPATGTPPAVPRRL